MSAGRPESAFAGLGIDALGTVDLRLYQFGCEQCSPLYSFGPHIRNHYLFHYVLSGRGTLTAEDGTDHIYELEAGQGFLICPGLVNTYSAYQR